MSINCAILSGNLTRDPEIRSTAGGTAVVSFGLAVNDRRKNQQTGQWEDYPNYIDCTMFGSRADSVSKYLANGMRVCVEGKLRWSQWEKDGQKRSKVEVIVDEIVLMQQQRQQPAYDPVQQQSAYQYQPQANAPQQPAYASQPAYAGRVAQQPLYDEDIPF